MNNPLNRKTEYMFLAAIFAAALFSRLWQFGLIPGDINQDEAFAGYEAWAIMNYGVDSSLHPRPVYLTAWGSGMNVLESLMMMPFIALFGLRTWVIRLPQLIVGLLSIAAAYGIGRRTGGERFGLLFALLLAVCPWHILLCRWGLESNLAPGFLLFGLYFFIRGTEDSRFLCLSALMYGLSLYSYATIWPVLPVILLLQLIYAASLKKLRADRYLLISALILAVLALPLMLFMLINSGYMDELVLPWISIPKLLVSRSGEVSFRHIGANLLNALSILLRRSDGLIWNSPERFGVFYILSLPLMLLGLISCVADFCRSLKKREFCPSALFLIQLLGGVLLCAMVSVNLNRMNILLMPLSYFEAAGLEKIFSVGLRKLGALVCAAYFVLFCCFEAYYFTDYAKRVRFDFSYGFEDALDAALKENSRDTVYISADVHYPKVLFYTETPPEEFSASVEYNAYPAAYLSAKSFSRFRFDPDVSAPDADAIYILRRGCDISAFVSAGFSIEVYGDYYLLLR